MKSTKLKLKRGMIIVREKDMRVWVISERTTKGYMAFNPMEFSEKTSIKYGEGVLKIDDFLSTVNERISPKVE